MGRNLLLMMLIFSLKSTAQSYLSGGMLNPIGYGAFSNPAFTADSTPGKKWFVTRQAGISTSFLFSKTGNATILAAPMGIQLNRRLNNNLYAFGAISVAPAYIQSNGSFRPTYYNKPGQHSPFMRSNQLNLFSRAEMGLMYVNDSKTFSISGSIGIEKTTYPMFQQNNQLHKPTPVVNPHR